MKDNLRKKINTLPCESGVYVMKNASNEIIYVGKAKNLKNRVSQYFHFSQKLPKVKLMTDNIADFDYFITPSELDAFILEKNLIAKNQPYFNILLKDGKAYPYIKTDPKETFPKFSVVRKVKNDGAKYFGPYFYGIDAYELLKTINYAYPIRSCNINFSKSKNCKRECLNFGLGLCAAPCTKRINEEEYDEIYKKAISFLKGNEKDVKDILIEKMQKASESENFESAIALREKIKMVEKLQEKTITDLAKDEEVDLFSTFCDEIDCVVNVMNVRNGKILGIANFLLDGISLSQEQNLENFILQYYKNKLVPKRIILESKIDFLSMQNLLFSTSGRKTKFATVEKGVFNKLMTMSKNNAKNYLLAYKSTGNKKLDFAQSALKGLKEVLNLKSLPLRIECYDISHISGTDMVGSMVVFQAGAKSAKHYRKFKIKAVEGNNDFECLKEVLQRRTKEYINKKDVSFSKKPDLIIIDGGKGQLSSVLEVIKNSVFKDVEIISLAKRIEEVFTPFTNQPIIIKKANPELRLLQNIRDEAHRFAITFHRSLRNKKMTDLKILQVEGVGEVLKNRLYQTFGNLKNIAKAEVLDIAKVKGISTNLAKEIKKFAKKYD